MKNFGEQGIDIQQPQNSFTKVVSCFFDFGNVLHIVKFAFLYYRDNEQKKKIFNFFVQEGLLSKTSAP
jgi:hypothetical protein